jgi:polysaccharide pyruvyl transferase WcaK-like protein
VSPRVLIAGSFGRGHAGDEATLSGLLDDLRRLRPDVEAVVVSQNPDDSVRRHAVSALAASDVPGLVRAVEDARLAILAGDGFHDDPAVDADTVLTRAQAGLALYGSVAILAALAGRPCMIYGVGVGPLAGDTARTLARVAFETAAVATVRDTESQDHLRALGLPPDATRVTADPAFGAPVDPERRPAGLERRAEGPRLAVCLRGPEADVATWATPVAAALDHLVRARRATPVFVPVVARGPARPADVGAAETVVGRMREGSRASVLRDLDDPAELATVLASCDVVIAMRAYAILFALRAGVPVVALDPEVAGRSLMGRLGLSDTIVPLDGLSPARLAGAVDAAVTARREMAAPLAKQLAELAALARENATLAVDLLERPRTPAPSPALAAHLKRLALGRVLALDGRRAALRGLTAQREQQDRAIDAAAGELRGMTDGKAWQLARRLARLRATLAPPDSLRDRLWQAARRVGEAAGRDGARAGLTAVGAELGRASRRAAALVARPRGLFVPRYAEEDNAVVTLYTDDPHRWPDYVPRRPLAAPRVRRVAVSLVATVRDEAAGVEGWSAAVLAQSRRPDEIVIVDGGSRDGTLARLQDLAARSPVPCVIVSEPGANIARGRNAGIRRARHAVVAVTDFGARPRPGWLDALVAPFEADPHTQVVAGWFDPAPDGRPGTRRWSARADALRPDRLLPSSRSLAFTRAAWESAGGYPEWLTRTGEDTYLALELKRYCSRWAFVPDAVVDWEAPASFRAYLRKLHGWAVGDGEAGLRGDHYWATLLRVVVAGAAVIGLLTAGALATAGVARGLSVALAAAAAVPLLLLAHRYRPASPAEPFGKLAADTVRLAGFVRGARRGPEIARRRRAELRGLVLVLSGVPIDDTGGGARATQLTLELLRQRFAVVFISRFPKYESVELDLRIVHPNLVTFRLADFDWSALAGTHPHLVEGQPLTVVVEFPLAEFLPVIAASRARGGVVVYDLLDEWNTALGGDWYSPDTERRIIHASQVLVATAPSLVARLEGLSGRSVALLPNAVNDRLFDRHRAYPRPADLPPADWTIMYVGALWGSWFDWELLHEVAARYPGAAVVVIGDYRGQCPDPLPNMHFLGLKPQRVLPAYLAAATVAIVPWTIDAITVGTSPLKVYEYLAMGKPVVAPDLPTLRDVPGVLRAADRAEFVRHVGQAREIAVEGDALDRFVTANAWAARVEQLVELVRAAR